MLDEVLSLLRKSSVVQRSQIVEVITYGRDGFRAKIRATVIGGMTFQVWLNHNDRHTRYSYQLLKSDRAVLRWDNAPHHPELSANFPHHFHDESGELVSSSLTGDPPSDLSLVLNEISDYLRKH